MKSGAREVECIFERKHENEDAEDTMNEDPRKKEHFHLQICPDNKEDVADEIDGGYTNDCLENSTDDKDDFIQDLFWEGLCEYLVDHGVVTQDEVSNGVAMLDTGSNCVILEKTSSDQQHHCVEEDALNTKTDFIF